MWKKIKYKKHDIDCFYFFLGKYTVHIHSTEWEQKVHAEVECDSENQEPHRIHFAFQVFKKVKKRNKSL